jgi:hypothetical protein
MRLDPCKGSWSVVIPYESANYIENPSFENGCYGYTGYGLCGLNPDPEYNCEYGTDGATVYGTGVGCGIGMRGGHGMRLSPMYPDGGGAPFISPPNPCGIYYEIVLNDDDEVVFSLYARSTKEPSVIAPRNATMFIADNAGNRVSVEVEIKVTSIWQRFHLRYKAPSFGTYRLVLQLDPYIGYPTSFTKYGLYTDCWQLERGTVLTTYLDGSLEHTSPVGYTWVAGDHESASVRAGYERSGGKLIPLSDYGFNVESITGLSSTQYTVIDSDYALLDGSSYQRTRGKSRDFTIVGTITGNWHQWMRQHYHDLLRAFSPHATRPYQPIVLYYQEFDDFRGYPTSIEYRIDCVYVSGLEGDINNRDGQKLAITFRMHDPYLSGIDRCESNPANTPLGAYYMFRRIFTTGVFGNLDQGVDGIVRGFGFFNGIYACGDMANFAAGPNPPASVPSEGVGRWDGESWHAVGDGLRIAATNSPTCTVVARNPYTGEVWAAGKFTSNTAETTTLTYLARLDSATDTWQAIDNTETAFVQSASVWTDSTSRIRDMAFDNYGGCLLIGTFAANGGRNASELNYINPDGTWATIALADTALTDGIIHGVEYSPDGFTPYVYGEFTTIGKQGGAAVTCNGVARYFNGEWEAIDDGVSTDDLRPIAVYDILFDARGWLVIVGDFDNAGGNAARYIARFTGTSWHELSNGFNAPARRIAYGPGIGTYVAGDFTEDGDGVSILPTGIAFLGGGRWQPLEFEMNPLPVPPFTCFTYALELAPTRNVWVGFDAEYEMKVVNPIEAYSYGSAPSYPIIKFRNDGVDTERVYAVQNWTTKIYLLVQSDIMPGETITITCGKAPSVESDRRPNLGVVLLPGSNLAEFVILPGLNIITSLAPNCELDVQWTERYDGIEGVR